MIAHVAAAVLASAVVVVIVMVAPAAGWRRYGRLLRDLRTDDRARLPFYRDAVIRQWVLAAVVVGIGVLAGRTPQTVGLPDYGPGTANGPLIAGVLAAAALCAVPAVILSHRFGPPLDESVARQLAPFVGIVPTTRAERRAFFLVALTAGVCEELVFRGFGIAYLRWLWPAAPWGALILATAVPFGLAHRYQGRNGMCATGLIGAALCWVTLATGTLIPAMVIHAAFDLRVLALRRDLIDALIQRQRLAAPPPRSGRAGGA
jgi:membrane protease YdiL (CAAX protease family)